MATIPTCEAIFRGLFIEGHRMEYIATAPRFFSSVALVVSASILTEAVWRPG